MKYGVMTTPGVVIDEKVVHDSDESDKKLQLLHRNVKQYVTIFNTIAAGCEITGVIRKAT